MEKMNAAAWLGQPQYKGIEVLDPDGWDRGNFQKSWAEQITEEEFNRRLMTSTCSFPSNYFANLKNGE